LRKIKSSKMRMISFSTVKNTILEVNNKRKILKNVKKTKIITIYITFKIQTHSPRLNPHNTHKKHSTTKTNKTLSCKKTELIP
jgi:hypothetical protein